MSDIHILDGGKLVFHIPTKVATSSTFVSYADIIVKTGRASTTVLPEGVGPGDITTAEKASLANGSVVEVVINKGYVPTDEGIKHLYNSEQNRLIAEWDRDFAQYGEEKVTSKA